MRATRTIAATVAGILIAAGVGSAGSVGAEPDRWVDAGAQVSQRPVPERGQVVYVAANGSDRRKGTADAPWRTVRHALSRVRPGGTVVVYGEHPGRGDGVYDRQSWGTIETADVTVQAYPGEEPRFVGAADLSVDGRTWRRDEYGWYLDLRTDASRSWPENKYPIPEQTHADAPLADDPRQLFVGDERRPLEQVPPPDAAPLAAGEFSWEPLGDRGGRIRVGDDPEGSSLWWSTKHVAVQVAPEGRGARIVGVAFEGYAPHHGDTLGAVRILANDVRLIDVTVRHSAGTGIVASGENGTLAEPLRALRLVRVSAIDNGALGASIGDAAGEGHDDAAPNDIVVEASRFDRNNRGRFDAEHCGGGRYCVLAGAKFVRVAGLRVTGSTFDDNASTGLWCDLYCDGVEVRDSRARGNAGSGIYVEVSRRATLTRNVLVGNGAETSDRDRAVGGVKVTGSTEVVLDGNTFEANRVPLVVGADHRDDDRAAKWHRGASGEPSITLRRNVVVVPAGEHDDGEWVDVVGDGAPARWISGRPAGLTELPSPSS